MLISFPRRPARNRSIISASSGWSCSRMRGTRAMDTFARPGVVLAIQRLSRTTAGMSLHLEAGRLHNWRPASKLLANELACRLGARVEDRLEAGRHQDALNIRIRHDLPGSLGDPLNDRLRHAGRSEQPVEIAGDHAWQSGLDRGRNIGRRLDAR